MSQITPYITTTIVIEDLANPGLGELFGIKMAFAKLGLERSEIPLHNNLSETDIREYVKRRKVSGSMRMRHNDLSGFLFDRESIIGMLTLTHWISVSLYLDTRSY